MLKVPLLTCSWSYAKATAEIMHCLWMMRTASSFPTSAGSIEKDVAFFGGDDAASPHLATIQLSKLVQGGHNTRCRVGHLCTLEVRLMVLHVIRSLIAFVEYTFHI